MRCSSFSDCADARFSGSDGRPSFLSSQEPLHDRAMQLTPVALDVVVGGMKQYPANMADFMDMFPTQDACLEYLSLVRWPGNGYRCLRCGKGDYWKKARGLFTCRACGYEASVLAGTVFQDTHKPLRLWFQAMWYVVSQKNGVSALGLQKALGLAAITPHGNGCTSCAAPWLSWPRQAIWHRRSGRDLSLAASGGVADVEPKASP